MLDDSKVREQRERKREQNRRWRAANLESVRKRNREGERRRRASPEFQRWKQEYYSRPGIKERLGDKTKKARRAWLAIPGNREKERERRREYKRRKREEARTEKSEVARLLDIFNRVWPRLLELKRTTECPVDRERIAEVILEVATDSADEVHVLAKRVIDKFCEAA